MASAEPRAGSGDLIRDGHSAAATPGSLIVSFCGLYLRAVGGWIAVADLVALLAAAGQSDPAVRQALARLKSRGFLAAEQQTGRAGYRLTAAGTADLAIGDGRIFRFGEAADTDAWVLAVFSVPEDARSERHRLRSSLAWWGFGTVGSGVWIAPVALADRARAEIQTAGLAGYVTWFTGRAVDTAQVGRWWNLDLLRRFYGDFLARWQTAPLNLTDRAAFAGYLELVDQWRRFPRIDPGLPASLLPPDWPGRAAFDTFEHLRQRWAGPAGDFVDRRLGLSR